MEHRIYRVCRVEIVAPYTLLVDFDDGTQQRICFKGVLGGELYRPLRNPTLFNQVYIDTDAHTLAWPNGADFDPATLHDWPQYVNALSVRAQRWESAGQGEAEPVAQGGR